MAKTIKFNLICDNKPIRTIEDLQDNFSIEDILKYYENGLLLRWLHVRGYEKEEKQVAAVSSKGNLEIAKALIKIFNIETEEKKIEEDIYMLQFLEEERKRNRDYKQNKLKEQDIVKTYYGKYSKLVNEIMEYPDNVAKIKAAIAEIVKDYGEIFALNYRNLFWKLTEKSVLAIMCLLMNEETRKYYYFENNRLQEEPRYEEKYAHIFENYLDVRKIEKENKKSKEDKDRKEMFDEICRIIKSDKFGTMLGDNLHRFSGDTDGYWKDLKPKGKKYMIISMGMENYVRSAGDQGGDLDFKMVFEKFVIVNGIDYKGKSNTKELLYMEV